MTKTVEVVQCGERLGTKASPELYGTCDRAPGHSSSRGGFHGHSSPLLREHMRDAAAKSRAKSKTLRETPELVEPEPEDKEPGATTEQEWWAQNIAKLERQNPELLAQHKAQRELCLDQIHWMKVGHNWDTNDPDFVDLEEGYADLEEFVATHGLVHNGIFIGVEGHVEKELVGRELWKADYWKYPKAMRALAASSPATAIYMRTGIMTAVPDWFYRQFKNRINKYGAIGVPSDFPRFELDRGRWFYKD